MRLSALEAGPNIYCYLFCMVLLLYRRNKVGKRGTWHYFSHIWNSFKLYPTEKKKKKKKSENYFK